MNSKIQYSLRIVIAVVTIAVFYFAVVTSKGCKLNNGININNFEGQWHVSNTKKLHTTSGVTSKELLDDLTEYNKKLATLKNKRIFINYSLVLTNNQFKDYLGWNDSIFLLNMYRYIRKSDTELTAKYPGDELVDTSNNKFVGETFMNLINSKKDYIDIIIGYDKDNEFDYRICIIDKKRIVVFSIGQNILMFLDKE